MRKRTDWFDYDYDYDFAYLTNSDTGNRDTYWSCYMTKWADWFDYDYDFA